MWQVEHGLFLKLHNLSNRQDAKVAKTNKIDVFACGETTSEKLGVLGVLAVKNAAYVVIQEKTMGADEAGRFGHARDAGDSVFPGNDGTVDQHASAPLDHRAGQRNDERHGRTERIADQDFPASEAEQVEPAVTFT